MDKAVIYIHGKGGNAEEAIHYKPLFSNCDVIGLDYIAQFPWEAKEEFPLLFNSIYRNYKTVEVIANSIGAYFATARSTVKGISVQCSRGACQSRSRYGIKKDVWWCRC